jgi:hypothetical protein
LGKRRGVHYWRWGLSFTPLFLAGNVFVLFCFVLFGYPLNRKQMTVFFVAGTAARSRNRITTKFVLNAFCAEQMNEQIWQKYVVMNC